MDVMREVQTTVENFHRMLENSMVYGALADLRISDGDLFLLLLRNLPERVCEHTQLVVGATTAN